MNTQLVKVEPSQLDDVVKNSGLEIQEGETIKQSYLPFLIKLAEIHSEASKINFETPTALDEKIARNLRIETVSVRTGAEKMKDSRKRIHLLKGNLEQSASNLISASCKLTEEIFNNVEKAREIKEKKRLAELMIERTAILSEVCDNPALYQVELMTEEAFSNLVEGQKLIKQQREQLAIKVEQERMAAIEAERAERERIRVENEALKQAQIDREKEIEAERLKQQKELEAERAEAAKKQKEIEDAARIEREKAEAERLKLEAELQSKRDAELKAASEANRIERDRLLNEAKAAKAPDKDKLKTFVTAITLPVFPDLKSEESKSTAEFIRQKFEAFKAWAVTQIESI